MTERRLGVYICYCGGNISDYVDVEKVRDVVANEPSVVTAKTNMFTCSDAAQQEMIKEINGRATRSASSSRSGASPLY